MTEGVKLVRFFLGANTPQGFVSRFDQLERQKDSWSTYIIKGGPGSGKSTLMKNLACAMKDNDSYIEEIYCSSDCDSLDGVIFHDRKASIADGTAPHTLEPKFPGAYDEIVNLCECWDSAKLRAHRDEIMKLNRRISGMHEQSTRFLAAYSALISDNYRLALECTNQDKIRDFAGRLANRELGGGVRHDPPHEDIRFISAICNKGVLVLEDTAKALAERIYVIDDEYSASSRILLSHLRALALQRGYDIITCYCPSAPFEKIEHLFISALSLGFMTSNRVHPLELEAFRTLHARRFTDVEALRQKKQRLSFNRKAAFEMLHQSTEYLAAAKELHDELESFYIEAMDFSRLESKRDETIEIFCRGDKD